MATSLYWSMSDIFPKTVSSDLGAPNMVKRGFPEKIIQNAAQMRSPHGERTPNQNLRPNQILPQDPN